MIQNLLNIIELSFLDTLDSDEDEKPRIAIDTLLDYFLVNSLELIEQYLYEQSNNFEDLDFDLDLEMGGDLDTLNITLIQIDNSGVDLLALFEKLPFKEKEKLEKAFWGDEKEFKKVLNEVLKVTISETEISSLKETTIFNWKVNIDVSKKEDFEKVEKALNECLVNFQKSLINTEFVEI